MYYPTNLGMDEPNRENTEEKGEPPEGLERHVFQNILGDKTVHEKLVLEGVLGHRLMELCVDNWYKILIL